jgi:hypothetical protein
MYYPCGYGWHHLRLLHSRPYSSLARTHTLTHTYTHAYTHTHTRTHTLGPIPHVLPCSVQRPSAGQWRALQARLALIPTPLHPPSLIWTFPWCRSLSWQLKTQSKTGVNGTIFTSNDPCVLAFFFSSAFSCMFSTPTTSLIGWRPSKARFSEIFLRSPLLDATII